MKSVRNVTLAAALSSFVPFAVAQEQLWVKQFGSKFNDELAALAPDDSGGAYVAGKTDWLLGSTSAGGQDAFIARYDDTGDRVWLSQFGSIGNDQGRAVMSDGAGGVFVTGITDDLVGQTHTGRVDVFLAHFDSEGNQSWITQFGSEDDDWANALATDGAGGVYICGHTNGDLGGPNSGPMNTNAYDAFLAHFDQNGTQTWIRQFGSLYDDFARCLAPDGTGGVFVGGDKAGALNNQDAFLARYRIDGSVIWNRRIPIESRRVVNALSSDGSGGVYLTGWASDLTGDVFPYLSLISGEGEQAWIKTFKKTNGYVFANAITPDGAGGLFIGGHTSDDFARPLAGATDAILIHCNADGQQCRLLQFGSNDRDRAYAVTTDGLGGVIVGGITRGDLGGLNAGLVDSFLARYSAPPPCYADLDRSTGVGVLDIFDFLEFQRGFVSSEPELCNCDVSTGVPQCDIFDFMCFQNAFVGGCP